jgi:hypothetical protein
MDHVVTSANSLEERRATVAALRAFPAPPQLKLWILKECQQNQERTKIQKLQVGSRLAKGYSLCLCRVNDHRHARKVRFKLSVSPREQRSRECSAPLGQNPFVRKPEPLTAGDRIICFESPPAENIAIDARGAVEFLRGCSKIWFERMEKRN